MSGKYLGGGVTQEKLRPIDFLFSDFYFYLIAVSESTGKENGSLGIYKVERFRSLTLLEEHFEQKKNREYAGLRRRLPFPNGGKLQHLRFAYRGQNVGDILDRLQTARIVSKEGDRYVIEAEVYGRDTKVWLRNWGDSIQILKE